MGRLGSVFTLTTFINVSFCKIEKVWAMTEISLMHFNACCDGSHLINNIDFFLCVRESFMKNHMFLGHEPSFDNVFIFAVAPYRYLLSS